jgi:uncharacterized Ntn-hydrolase superfamily protein
MKKGTFSLVVRDPLTGRIAVAGASHWFGYAILVPFAKAGIGAIATQAECNTSYGSEGLELLEKGLSPEQVVENLINNDSNKNQRQLIVIDRNGNTAEYTGSECVKFNGHLIEENLAIAGNMLANDLVLNAIKENYISSDLPFEEKILTSLKAGQDWGGDIRGKRSLGMIIVEPESKGKLELDTFVNIRIDDSEDPFEEAIRLLKRAKAYKFMNLGDIELFEKNNKEKALEYYSQAFNIDSDNNEVKFWYAKTLIDTGEVTKGEAMLSGLLSENPNWKEFAQRIGL